MIKANFELLSFVITDHAALPKSCWSSVHDQGSHPTWKTLKAWNFVSLFFQAWNLHNKLVKTWNFNSKPGKNMKFSNSMFQTSVFKMSFTKIILIYFFCHIYIINRNTDLKSNWPWISLLLPGNNLENIWNFVSQEKWEPWWWNILHSSDIW